MKNFIVNTWIFAFGRIWLSLLDKELKMGIALFHQYFFFLYGFCDQKKEIEVQIVLTIHCGELNSLSLVLNSAALSDCLL